MGDDRLGAACGVLCLLGRWAAFGLMQRGRPGREDASPNLSLRVSRVFNSNLPIRVESGYFLPEFRLKTSIPLQNLKLFFGLEALNATYAPATSRNTAYLFAWQRWKSHLSALGCWSQFQAPRLSRR